MIVPDQGPVPDDDKTNRGIFYENHAFARQWQAKDPTRRTLVTMPVGSGPVDFAVAVENACKAAFGHTVILFVGHAGIGGRPTGHGGWTVAGFDSVPELGPMQGHRGVITQDVLTFEQYAEKDANGQWVPKAQQGQGVTVTDSGKVNQFKDRYDAMTRVAAALRAAQVKQFYVLSCNVGNDQSSPDLATMLYGFLGVPVRMPKAYVFTAKVIFTGPTAKQFQIWFAHDRDHGELDEPPSDDRNHPSFSEYPTSPVRDVP